MNTKKAAIYSVLAVSGLMLAHLAWSSQSLRPAPSARAPALEQSAAGALSSQLERTFRSVSYANVTLRPEAIEDPEVRARLERFDAALRSGLGDVHGMAEGFERTDRARALAGYAVGLATILWQTAFEAAAASPTLDARLLWTWARRSNDLGGELIDAAGVTSSPIHLQDLAKLRRSYDNNRSNIPPDGRAL